MRPTICSSIPAVISVAMGPGWMLLIVMRRGARSSARFCTIEATAALLMAYTLLPTWPVRTAVLLPMVITRPPSAIGLTVA